MSKGRDIALLAALGGAYWWMTRRGSAPSPRLALQQYHSPHLVDPALKAALTVIPAGSAVLSPAIKQSAQKLAPEVERAAKDAAQAIADKGYEVLAPLGRALEKMARGIMPSGSLSLSSTFVSVPVAGAFLAFAGALVSLILSWGGPPPPNISPQEVFFGLSRVDSDQLWRIIGHVLNWHTYAGYNITDAEDFLLNVPTDDDSIRKHVETYKRKWLTYYDALWTIRMGLAPAVPGNPKAVPSGFRLPRPSEPSYPSRLVPTFTSTYSNDYFNFNIVNRKEYALDRVWPYSDLARKMDAWVRLELSLRRGTDQVRLALPKVLGADGPDSDTAKRWNADAKQSPPWPGGVAPSVYGLCWFGDWPAEEWDDLRKGLLWAVAHRLNREAALAEGQVV